LAWLAAPVCSVVLLAPVLDAVKSLNQRGRNSQVLTQETTLWCPVSEATDPVRFGVHPRTRNRWNQCNMAKPCSTTSETQPNLDPFPAGACHQYGSVLWLVAMATRPITW